MQSLTTLEYGKLLALIARHAQTPMGKGRLENLQPLTSRLELDANLQAAAEIELRLLQEIVILEYFPSVPTLKCQRRFCESEMRRSTPFRCLKLRAYAIRRIRPPVLSPEREAAPGCCGERSKTFENAVRFLGRLNRKVNCPAPRDDDSASPELARLRLRNKQTIAGGCKNRSKPDEKFRRRRFQDQIVTQRNERFVVPGQSRFSRKVSGVAHGFSSSGATVFVEPLEAIEANNELQNLKGKEEREVARILFALTEDLRANLPAIESAVEAVAELDFVKAKSEFARRFNAVVPTISTGETLDLTDARHPLLEENLRGSEHEIVPVSFILTKEKPVMIISGANAGGKTVVMKTAGLLSLMAISGLPVPARAATIPFYKSVLADIGDHQSLAANLSTFSSHISNIAGMMRDCHSPSLVLLDEVGTGTDPDEGSALGVAIVDYFRRKCGAQVVASTHYRGLKIYAANDENVINASVEFNEKTLQPTYRLLVGLAGASSGIEIARRFGIRDEVIETARRNLDISAQVAENYLKNLQAETTNAIDLRKALEEEREAVAYKYATLEIEAKKREKERRREFERELAETVEGFEKQSRAFINSIEDKALKAKLEKERAARKAELNRAVLSQVQSPKSKAQSAFDSTENSEFHNQNLPVVVGAKVRTSFGNVGTVEKIDKDSAEVLVGAMRLREKLSNLQTVSSQTKQSTESNKQQTRGEKLQAQAKNSNLRLDTEDKAAELNLIGRTTADAEYEIDRFFGRSISCRPAAHPNYSRLRHRRAEKLRPSFFERTSARRALRIRAA
jgi:DNA mismatch repair protein MutS2